MKFEHDTMSNILCSAAISLAPKGMSRIKTRAYIKKFLHDNAPMFKGFSEMYISEEEKYIHMSLVSKKNNKRVILVDGTKRGVYVAVYEKNSCMYNECLSMFIQK